MGSDSRKRSKGAKQSKGGKRKKGAAKPAGDRSVATPAESPPIEPPPAEPPPIAEAPVAGPAIESPPSEEQPPESPPEFLGDGLKDESAIDSPYTSPAPIELQVRYAGLVRRSAALTFDLILLALVDILTVGYLFGRFAWDFMQPLAIDTIDPLSDPDRAQQTILVFLGIFLLNWLYFTACECSPFRRTLGMAVFNARVIRLLPDGSLSTKVSFLRANARFLARGLTALTLGIGFVISLASKKRQSLHDRISGTLVVVE